MKILGKFLKILGIIVLTLTAFLIVCILFYFGKLKLEELQAHREIKAVQTEMQPLSAEYIPENITLLVLLICSFSLPVLGNQLLLLSDAVDWFCSPTARRFSKGSNHSLFVTLLIS